MYEDEDEPELNYDQSDIPAGYDRGRDHGPEVLDLWMRVIESHVGGRSVSTILDLGCGTGRFSGCLANPYVPFFPSTRRMLEDLLPNRARLRAVFEKAGFLCVGSQVVMQTIAQTWEAYADKLAAGGDSVLARLAETELSRGLDAVRRHDPGGHERAVVEAIDVFFFQLQQSAA